MFNCFPFMWDFNPQQPESDYKFVPVMYQRYMWCCLRNQDLHFITGHMQ